MARDIILKASEPTRRTLLLASGATAGLALLSRPAIGQVPSFDVVIVGGGSAGAVLARRLSEDPARRVLLLEAGPGYEPEAYPDPVRRQAIVGGDAEHGWGYLSEPLPGGRTIPLPRGRVLGGSSAINGAVAMRAPRADFDRWAAGGLTGWSHAEALATHERMERGPDGTGGPWPIHQLELDEVSEMQRAFILSAEAAGHPRADLNGAAPAGVGPYPMNTRAGDRLNTGMTYLARDVRARPNLTIRAGALADRVETRDGRATALVLAGGERIAAGEVILAAGTYGSAALLLRSGVGPAVDLRALGVPVVADLPVGQGLQDHPFVPVVFAADPERVGLPMPVIGALLWAASSRAAPGELDLHVTAVHFGDPSTSPTGAVLVLGVAIVRPQARGALRLRDLDPASAPVIDLNLLGEAQDRTAIMEGVALARTVATTGPLSEMIAAEMFPGAQATDGESLAQTIPMALDTYHHPTSTAPMGGDADPRAVVDAQGRVRGVAGLRVSDAAIFPDVPSVATGTPVVMLAERIAALADA